MLFYVWYGVSKLCNVLEEIRFIYRKLKTKQSKSNPYLQNSKFYLKLTLLRLEFFKHFVVNFNQPISYYANLFILLERLDVFKVGSFLNQTFNCGWQKLAWVDKHFSFLTQSLKTSFSSENQEWYWSFFPSICLHYFKQRRI